MKNIKVKTITAQTITFEVDDDTMFTMPLEDAAKIIDAINKYANIFIASRSLEEFMR